MKPLLFLVLSIVAVIMQSLLFPNMLITLVMPVQVAHYYGWPVVIASDLVLIVIPAMIASLSLLFFEKDYR